jgi:uncharacterized protein
VVVATLVLGTAALAATLAAPRGSAAFTALGVLVAAVWLAGSAIAGPPALGPGPGPGGPARRQVLGAAALGAAAFLAFVGAELVARRIPVLDDAVDSILSRADAGPLAVVLAVALLNGAAEEVFFRGTLLDALPGRHRAVLATAVYVAVTAATGNLALVLAAVAMGTLLMVQRLATGTVLGPIVTHLTWSVLMLLAFPS